MTRVQLKALQIGDKVVWVDPDTGLEGDFYIQEIVTEYGYLNEMDDVLVITDGAMTCHEIFAAELIST